MKQIYFDNGASSYPKPRGVYDRTFSYVLSNGANSGRSSHFLAMQAAEVVYDTRRTVADFFGLNNAENVVFTLNATYALNMVLQGLLAAGDHVITTVMEHNSVLRPLYELEKKGVQLSIVDVDLYNDKRTVDNIAVSMKKNTRAIVVSQCSNVCGKMLPIDSISEIKGGARLVVDGSQGAGSIPTNLIKSDIDYYCAPFHKGMLGLQGGGFLLCRHNELHPLVFGGTGGESTKKTQPLYLPERLEAGTLPIPSILSLREGIGFLNTVGIEKIFNHKKSLAQYLYRGLRQIPDVQIYVDYTKTDSPGVVAFNYKQANSEEVATYLASRGVAVRAGLHCAPLFHKKMGTSDRGMVRISLGYANTKKEIDDFLKYLKFF